MKRALAFLLIIMLALLPEAADARSRKSSHSRSTAHSERSTKSERSSKTRSTKTRPRWDYGHRQSTRKRDPAQDHRRRDDQTRRDRLPQKDHAASCGQNGNRELHHGSRFWRLAETLCQDLERARGWLAENGPGLHRYGRLA